MLIPFSRQKFAPETGDLVDEETRDRLRRFLSALAEWTLRFEEAMKAPPETVSREKSPMAAGATGLPNFRASQRRSS